ncbi:MAG: hypothetical protein V3R25_05880 [Nitrosomonadaceae bacterium]
MAYPTVGSGNGNSFAIGPVPNEFRSTTRAGAITLLDIQSDDFPDWLAIYDAAPIGFTGGADLNVRIFYTKQTVNYMELLARDNGDWVVNASFEGVVGQEGADGIDGSGVTSTFNSLDSLNAYMLNDDTYQKLQIGDNVAVNVGGVIFQYIWTGDDLPTAYDPLLFERSEIGTTTGSLIMGPTSLESAGEMLMFTDADDNNHYLIQSHFDSAGSKLPSYLELDAEIIFDLALVDTDELSPPMKTETTMTFESISDAFICKPASSGILSFKTYIGTEGDHQDQPLLDEKFEIESGMVGTEVTIPIKNPAVIQLGVNVYSIIEGVSLFGGLQTIGPMTGQTVPFNRLHLQKATRKPMALKELVDGIEVNTSAKPTLIEINTVIGGVSRTQNINSVGANAGLMEPADKTKLDGIEALAEVNTGEIKVKAAGASAFLETAIAEGANISIVNTDDLMTISATGGALADATVSVADGYLNVDYDDILETDTQLIQADKAGTVLTRPEYETSTAAPGTTIIYGPGANEFPAGYETPFSVNETTEMTELSFATTVSATDLTVRYTIYSDTGPALSTIILDIVAADTGTLQTYTLPFPIVLNPGGFLLITTRALLGDTQPELSINSTGNVVTQQISLSSDKGGNGGAGGSGGGLEGATVTVNEEDDLLDVKFDTTQTEAVILQAVTTDSGVTFTQPTLGVETIAYVSDIIAVDGNDRVGVNAADGTPNYLEDKIKSGSNITIVEKGTGATKHLEISSTDVVGAPSNLTADVKPLTIDINNDNGTGVTLPAATITDSGVLTNVDKVKLDGIEALAEVNVGTNISTSSSETLITVGSSTGASNNISAATTGKAGIMTKVMFDKFDGIEALAEVNVPSDLSRTTSATNLVIDNTNGTGFTIPKVTSAIAGLMIPSDSDKLDGIAAGAQPRQTLTEGVSPTTYDITISDENTLSLGAAGTTNAGLFLPGEKTKLSGIEALAEVNDNQVLVSGDDTTEGYLVTKIIAGDGVHVAVKDIGAGVEALEITSDGGSVDIGGIILGDIYTEGLKFVTPSDKEYVIPQVEYEEGTNVMGAPFFFNKGTGLTEVYPSVNREDSQAIQIKSLGSYQVLSTYDGQPINKMKIKVGPNHTGVTFSLALHYTNASGTPTSTNTEQITCTDAIQELDVNILSSIVLSQQGTIDIRVGANYSSSDVVELMGESGAFAEDLWIDWSAESISGTTTLLTGDFAFEGQNDGTNVSVAADDEDVFTGTLPAGRYKVEYGCTLVSLSSSGIRYGQLEFFSNLISIQLQQGGAISSGTNPYAGNITGVALFTAAEGDAFALKMSATNYTATNHTNAYCFITKIG